MRRQPTATTLCLLVVLVLAGALSSGPVVAAESDGRTGTTGIDATDRDPVTSGNNSSLGTSISSFVQVSAVETRGELDRGMWRAAYRGAASERARAELLATRIETLVERLDALEARLDRAENASTSGPPSLVRDVLLAARTASLRRTIDATARVADVDSSEVSGFATLRERVRSLQEPRVPPVPGASLQETAGASGASGATRSNATGVASTSGSTGPTPTGRSE
jgi:hypothetical protein